MGGGGGWVQKNKYFFGLKILWLNIWGNHKIGLYLGVIFMHFRVLSYGQNRGYFLGLLKFQIFFGMLEIPHIFGGEG